MAAMPHVYAKVSKGLGNEFDVKHSANYGVASMTWEQRLKAMTPSRQAFEGRPNCELIVVVGLKQLRQFV